MQAKEKILELKWKLREAYELIVTDEQLLQLLNVVLMEKLQITVKNMVEQNSIFMLASMCNELGKGAVEPAILEDEENGETPTTKSSGGSERRKSSRLRKHRSDS